MTSLLHTFSQACCNSGPNFSFALKMIYWSPGSHEKIIFMIFFVVPTSVTKIESSSTW